MNQLILLDTGPLGMVTNPKANPDCQACKQWLSQLESNGDRAATTNVGHLSRFTVAKTWQEI